MAKYRFTQRTEWSDQSPHSPSATGQIPHAVILPDGERVGLDVGDIEIAKWNQDKMGADAYVQLHANVRVRDSFGGDDHTRRHGRDWSTLEVLAPKGSRFLFARICPVCGDAAGEQELPGKTDWERAEEMYHEECAAIQAAQDETA